MIKDELVTVVIPAYNAEEYIRDCIYATLNQTYTNLEILIIDNGSSDSTLSICREYAGRDTRIKIFTIENNNGVSAARNLGISNAGGKYIVFFDADDVPDSDIIERYMDALGQWRGKDVSFIVCGMYYDNLFNTYVENKVCILEPYYGFIEGENYLLDRKYASTLAWLKIFNFVTNKIYDTQRIKNKGIRFDEKIHIGEDLKFNLDYLGHSNGYIGMINKPLYHYIKRSDSSLSFTYHDNDIEDTKEIYRRFLEWEKSQKGVTDDNILVIQSIFITDWISRLATMHDHFKRIGKLNSVKRKLDKEIQSREFQEMLNRVHKARKISSVRYLALKTGNFDVFCFLRGVYQLMKG